MRTVVGISLYIMSVRASEGTQTTVATTAEVFEAGK